jgi:hypothetical protein
VAVWAAGLPVDLDSRARCGSVRDREEVLEDSASWTDMQRAVFILRLKSIYQANERDLLAPEQSYEEMLAREEAV